MNARRGALEERVSRNAVWVGAGLALVGLTVALAWGAGLSTGTPQTLFAVEQRTSHVGGGVALSPDGKTLVYVAQDSQLYAVNVDTGQKQLLLKETPSKMDVFYDPAFSPDGTQLAFVARGGTRYYPSDIYSIHADGSGLTQLTHGKPLPPEVRLAIGTNAEYSQYFSSPQFAPDGTKILMRLYDEVTSTDNPAVMNPDGSQLRTVAPGMPLFWSSDGQSVFLSRSDSVQVQELDLLSNAATPIQGLTGDILGKLPDKDWFGVPAAQNISLLSVQNGAATFQASWNVPLSEVTGQGLVSLVSFQWTRSGRVLLFYQGDNIERFEVAQPGN